MCTKGSGTNSVKPPLRRCWSRTRSRCRAQLRGPSTWPNMIVAVDRPAGPGLLGTADDLVERDEVRGPAEVRGEPALREGAEAAAEVADVRVVHVPRDDVGDRVAADLATQVVRRPHDGSESIAPC